MNRAKQIFNYRGFDHEDDIGITLCAKLFGLPYHSTKEICLKNSEKGGTEKQRKTCQIFTRC